MDGYDIITSDEHKVGHVVGVEDDLLIAESGLVRKKQHAIPSTFAHVDDAENVVRVSVSKELIADSPEVEDGSVDRRAIAEYYGLAEGYAAPETLGEGEVVPDDPARSEEVEELQLGREPEPARRARMLKGEDEPGPHGRQIIPADPHDER